MKKGILSLSVILSLIASMITALPMTANAYSDGVLSYDIIDGKAVVTDCDEDATGNLVIPDTLGGYSVTRIAENAFLSCQYLESIKLPIGLKNIDYEAFNECAGLKSFDISDENGFFTTADGVLYDKLQKELIAYPNNKQGKSFEMSKDITSVRYAAFDNPKNLENIYVDDTNTAYADIDGVLFTNDFRALLRCPCGREGNISLIPNNATYIEYGAFRECEKLTSIEIPSNITLIGIYAFYGCTNLANVEIPSTITSVGCDAFYDTAWYNNQSDGLVYIGKVAYKYKGTMPENTSIVLKEDTVSISDLAFDECTGLTNIEIPSGVTYVGYGAFNNTGWYNNQPDGLVYAGNVAYKYKGEMSDNALIELKDGTVSIADVAFEGCTSLASIEIPCSVDGIGYSVFAGCDALKIIYFTGTDEQWQTVLCNNSDFNYFISEHKDITVVTNYECKRINAEFEKSGNVVNVSVSDEDIPDTATIYIMSYDSDGRLKEVKKTKLTEGVVVAQMSADSVKNIKVTAWSDEFAPYVKCNEWVSE